MLARLRPCYLTYLKLRFMSTESIRSKLAVKQKKDHNQLFRNFRTKNLDFLTLLLNTFSYLC